MKDSIRITHVNNVLHLERNPDFNYITMTLEKSNTMKLEKLTAELIIHYLTGYLNNLQKSSPRDFDACSDTNTQIEHKTQ